MRVVIDTREQWPLAFSAEVQTVRGTLAVGDYSIEGLEDLIVIERKSLSDLLSSITSGRERFVKELRQLRAFRFAALVIEARWPDLLTGMWSCPSQVAPNAVIGSLMSFVVKYGVVPILADDHQTAGVLTEKLLHIFCRIIEKDYREIHAGKEMEAAK